MLKAYEIAGKIFRVGEATEFKSSNGTEYTKGTLTVISGVKYEVDGRVEYDNEFIELEFIEKKKEKDSYVKDQLNKFKKDDIITFSCELKIEAFVKKDGKAGYLLKAVNPNVSIFENSKNNLDIKKNEKIEVLGNTKENKIYRLALSVDNEKPTIEIKNKKGVYEFSHPNKKVLTYKLFKDGKEIKFQNQISKSGNYKLVIKDKLGNENTYNFKIKCKISAASIIFISVISISIISAIIFMIHKRRRMKVA